MKHSHCARLFLCAATASIWASAANVNLAEANEATGETPEKPNIILIMPDDQGYGDLGVTGNPIVETPNIDALARRSASMTTFYVSPVCSPTRACLMTGRYNYRTGVVDTFKGRSMMQPEEITIAEVLKDAGYTTGIFGKWHLGDCYPMRPQDQGFDEALVHLGGGLAQPSEPIENRRRYTDPILFHNGTKIAAKGYCTDVYFEAASQFIDHAHSAGKPFFVYLPPNAPHGPFHDVPKELYDKYRQKDLSPVLLGNTRDADVVARVFAMIENIDRNIGQLITQLEANGLIQNTIVVFMVDNGPNTARFVGPFRGKKTEVHEGGIRSPFYAQWPARLKPGTTSDRVAAHIDVMPTLLDAAGVPLPSGLKLDGRSLLPLLEGRDVDWPDRTIFIQSHRGNIPVLYHHFAVRNQRWKLVRPTGFGREAPSETVPFELYDMTVDPKEQDNLAATKPVILETLKRAYAAQFSDVSTTRPDNFAPPRIIVGSNHEIRTVLTQQDWRVKDNTGWGRNGEWHLRFEGEHRYDIELLWPDAIDPAQIEVNIGNVQETLEVKSATRSALLRNVQIPEGDAELAARITQKGTALQPYQVVLIQK